MSNENKKALREAERPSRTDFTQTLLTQKDALTQHLNTSTTPVASLQIIRKTLSLQAYALRTRKRISLSMARQFDLEQLFKFQVYQKKAQAKLLEKEFEVSKARAVSLQKLVVLSESTFINEDFSKELLTYLLGEKTVSNLLTKGLELGLAEFRKESEDDWKKVNLWIYQNVVIALKSGTDIILAVMYINSEYKIIFAEDQKRQFMVKLGKYVISADTKQMINTWKERIENRHLWFQALQKPKASRRRIPLIGEMTAVSKSSMSILFNSQLSPHLEMEEVVGVDLHVLSEREHNAQQAPLVYRLLIQYFIDNSEFEGIFRVPGSGDDVASLERTITKRSFSLEDLKGVDPYAIASTLKHLLKELPVPLIPKNMNDKIQELVALKSPQYVLVISVRKMVTFLKEKMPEHFEVFRLLCVMISEIVNQCPTNKMCLGNVLTCFVGSVKCSPSIFLCAVQNQGIFFDSLFLLDIN
ncbi:hypothetical protein EIN_056760 [Entamoeba invadens IP1]|uniref:hypothetical protein n=1 Tax=Entamoeba invadens IP1 TaxID=370355 RepID=UPI0002C3F841|nr:hypothetical protein EIN_056760 [Entamoeba invadens IP1]ELP93291.1 hypothetical protein EIN_056760 [Entamoeba invadens IP1]|eukprot:XP_004260062.1 hypothetical protein EIN_056760 [Entamoeba invadens IP1]